MAELFSSRQAPDAVGIQCQEADRLQQDALHPAAADHHLAAEAVHPQEADTGAEAGAAEAEPVAEEDKKNTFINQIEKRHYNFVYKTDSALDFDRIRHYNVFVIENLI